MKTYSITLPDDDSEGSEQDADALGISVESYLAALVQDTRSARRRERGQSSGASKQSLAPSDVLLSSLPSTSFSVAREFPNHPGRSIELTQAFVDEALKVSGGRVHKHKRSLIFTPRFVFVDYPYSNRGDNPGLVVSCYGERDQFDDPRGKLYPGRKSYSRMQILNDEDLSDAFRFLRKAYELRAGNREA